MIRALYTAASGMNAQQTNIDNMAHNLANVNTAGFKKAGSSSRTSSTSRCAAPGTPNSTSTETPIGLEIGLGTRAVGTARDFASGNLQDDQRAARRRDAGPGLLPGHAARRPHRLHPRRRLPHERRGRHRHRRGLSARAGDHHPGRRDVDQHLEGRRRLGDRRRPERARSSSARSSSRRSRTRRGCTPLGGNLFAVTTASGEATTGAPGTEGLGTHRSRASSRSRTSASSRRWST